MTTKNSKNTLSNILNDVQLAQTPSVDRLKSIQTIQLDRIYDAIKAYEGKELINTIVAKPQAWNTNLSNEKIIAYWAIIEGITQEAKLFQKELIDRPCNKVIQHTALKKVNTLPTAYLTKNNINKVAIVSEIDKLYQGLLDDNE